MNVRHRLMVPEDIPECTDLLVNDPAIGARYRPVAQYMPAAWLRMVQSEAGLNWIFHANDGTGDSICTLGLGAIVTDDFLRELKAPPHFWTGPELIKRVARGESPFLTLKEIREANSGDGLNLVCWNYWIRPGWDVQGFISRYSMSVFVEQHRGYFWKEIVGAQVGSTEQLDFVLGTGGFLWNSAEGKYTSILTKPASEIVASPHVIGTTRELEANRGPWSGSWVGNLFDYHPPKLGLSRSEQRMLSLAIPGATDETLAEQMEVSLSSIKKLWISVYRRAEESLPQLIADAHQGSIPPNARGREKRRGLLAYVREHPEELRPVSRKRAQT